MGFPILVRWHLYIESGAWLDGSTQTVLHLGISLLLNNINLSLVAHLSSWKISAEIWLNTKLQKASCRLPLRVSYGVSLVSLKSNLILTLIVSLFSTIACCIGPSHYWTELHYSIRNKIVNVRLIVLMNTMVYTSLITRLMGPTWVPSGADRTQVGPMLAPWTLLSGLVPDWSKSHHCDSMWNHHSPVLNQYIYIYIYIYTE